MALSFVTSADHEIEIVVTCDPSIQCDEDQKSAYYKSGDLNDLGDVKDATRFIIRALSPSDREQAEVSAGAYTRSELGRLLWLESPNETKERARWHHELEDDEKEALAQYTAYLNRVYIEMIRASLISIDGETATYETIDNIRPESIRTQTISELVLHIQRISLLGDSGK